MGIQYVGSARLANTQNASVSGTSATFTNPFSTGVRRFRLSATVDICYLQGKAPLTATTTNCPVVYAGSPEYFNCNEGESIAVIARDGTSTGTAYLSEAV